MLGAGAGRLLLTCAGAGLHALALGHAGIGVRQALLVTHRRSRQVQLGAVAVGCRGGRAQGGQERAGW